MISSLDDNQKKKLKYLFTLITLLTLSIMLFILSFRLSRYPYELSDVMDAVFRRDYDNQTHDFIILKLIRLGAIMLTGGALSLSGLLMQTITRNDLASPSILGVSSAVSLSATVFAVYFITTALTIMFMWATAFAFIPMIIILGVMKLSGGRVKGVYLAFLGIALGVIMNSLAWFIRYNQDQSGLWLESFLNSGFTNIQLERLKYFTPIILAILFVNIIFSKKYQLLEPGDEFSKGIGNNVMFIRAVSIISVGLLVPASMMLGGNILYVGLIVPHIVKLFLKTKNFLVVSIATILTGIILLLLIQIISSYIPLNFGSFIDLLAAPVLIILARRS